MKREAVLLYLGILVFCDPVFGNNPNFEKNQGQWPANVFFKTEVNFGRAFFEKNNFTYAYYSIEKPIDASAANPKNRIKCHSYKTNFVGCSNSVEIVGENKQTERINYFIGQNRRRWIKNIDVFGGVRYKGIYHSVDLFVYSQNENLKYDFILRPGANYKSIKLQYEGVSACLQDGNLILRTSINEIVEQAPYAYQVIDGNKIEVSCKYILKGNIVSFEILSSYNSSIPLIIDPVIIASTYSGANITNYGSCATYDSQGNIYGGASCVGIGYPSTIGAYDTSFCGMQDVVISKLNPTGSSLIYATYLGGDNFDFVQSMYVNSNMELCLLGSTRSANFPTSLGCYDNSFNGGRFDIFVTHLDSIGSNILGSTFIGGNNDDGTYDSLHLDWANEKIGEILSDSLGLIYATSSSKSSDFPITAGARSNSGSEDVVAFKLSGDCSTLLWSTCVGGGGDEAGNGLRISGSDVLLTGRTNSQDFPITGTAYNASYQGGAHDGYVCKLSTITNSILASTYFGTSSDDVSFLLDIDFNNCIYIIGQTTGNLPITPGCFGNLGSMNFISKFNPDLTSIVFQTVIGNGGGFTSSKNIMPTAFFIDTCENIYFSGFNAWLTTNSNYPLTSNAFSVNPSRQGYFYLAELAPNASFLKFGSYLNGASSGGGNSRFDKYGILYQAISAYAANPVITTQNSYSPFYPNAYNDMALLKIDFQSGIAHANAIASPDSGCKPFITSFSSINSRGINFYWDFGDGSPMDTARNPVHTFIDTGNFHVRLIVTDSSACIFADTFDLNIYVAPELTQQTPVDTIICNFPTLVLQSPNSASSNTYLWNTNSHADFITVNNPGIYWVSISNGICSVKDTFIVDKLISPNIGPDTTLCAGQFYILNPQSNGGKYEWSTGDTTSTISIDQSNTYWVDVSLQECILRDSIEVNYMNYPIVDLGIDTILCPNTPTNIHLEVGVNNSSYSIEWSTGEDSPSIIVSIPGYYWVNVANGQCQSHDSINISESQPLVKAQVIPFFCSYDEAWLDALVDNVSYLWSTGETSRRIHIGQAGEYWYQITYNGCKESDTLEVAGTFGDSLLWIPSAFTPNGDGRNDTYIPIGKDIQKFEMDIFNRWGERVFSTSDLTFGWDGRQNGKLAQSGVYTYLIKYTTTCSENNIVKSGCFLLVE